jgi:anti-anti-sigma factor
MEYTVTDAAASVFLRGDLTFSDHRAFLRLAERLLADGTDPITLNFQELSFIDSSGLGMLLIARDEASKRQRSLVLKGARGQVRKMFDLSRFETLFAIEP